MTEAGRKTVFTLIAFVAFIIFGTMESVRSLAMPFIITEYNITNTAAGMLQGSYFTGFLISAVSGGILSDRYGRKFPALIFFGIFVTGILLLVLTKAYFLLTVAVFMIGCYCGSLEIGCQEMISDMHHERKGQYLSYLNVFYSIGMLVSSMILGRLHDGGVPWRLEYGACMILMLLYPLAFMLLRYPKSDLKFEHQRVTIRSFWPIVFSKKNILLFVMIICYVSFEQGYVCWIARFSQAEKGFSIPQSAFMLTLFVGLAALGRLIGALFIDKIPYMRLALYSSTLSLIAVLLGTYASGWQFYLLPLSGLFSSVIFTCVLSYFCDLNQRANYGTVLGAFIAFVGIGGVAGNWTTGKTSDLYGLSNGMASISVFLLVIIICSVYFIRKDGIIRVKTAKTR